MNELIQIMLQVSQEVKNLKALIHTFKKTRIEQFNETWIDGQEVMQSLHISKRTLHTLRNNGTLPYSRLNGKFYYKVADIEQVLESNYLNSEIERHGNH